jgi:hypothetical protein
MEMDCVYVTEHAAERFHQRGIRINDVYSALKNGEIIEQYPDDFPFPSCLILGRDQNNKHIHVCMSDEGTSSRIITAYYPDSEKWEKDWKNRRGICK